MVAGMVFHADFTDPMQSILFMKNLAMAGSLLVLAVAGPGGLAFEGFWRRGSRPTGESRPRWTGGWRPDCTRPCQYYYPRPDTLQNNSPGTAILLFLYNFLLRNTPRLVCMMLVVIAFNSVPPAIGGVNENTRAWVIQDLRKSLQQPPHMNRLASMLLGLVGDYQTSRYVETGRLLEDIGRFIKQLNLARLDCGQLMDLRIAGYILAMVNIHLDTEKVDVRLDGCDLQSNPFNLAVALFLSCHIRKEDPEKRFPGGLKRLESLQRRDGSFGMGFGLSNYYLSSHAVFALNECQGRQEVVRKGHQYMLNYLAYFKQIGFIDGLLENLVMLEKMAVPVPDYQSYEFYIRAKIKRDGGVCRVLFPGCITDWHATGLLLEFQRLQSDTHP